MASLTTRPFVPGDVNLLLAFARAVRPRERIADYPSVSDLPDLLKLVPTQRTARLWLDEHGQLIAFAFVDAFQTLRFDLDWPKATPALEAAIVRWAAGCLQKGAEGTVEWPVLYATCHEADTRRFEALRRQGFALLDDCVLHMIRPLDAPVAEPILPPGFAIRPLAGEQEATEVALLHRMAFGTPHITAERRLAMMRAPHYDPSLDLVVVAPSGELAAYGMGSVSPQENELTGRNDCYADLFATHPAYRGLGLAQALMLSILRLLQGRGYENARLSTASENLAMQRAAACAGFRRESATLRLRHLGPSG
ncbi:MAG TPA: GNAT family N-acetyltransferase [Ardenticatenaceae bacterium]|nr:GNAT family N-acetyltransferase [Ardenticatenaceae bacterium]